MIFLPPAPPSLISVLQHSGTLWTQQTNQSRELSSQAWTLSRDCAASQPSLAGSGTSVLVSGELPEFDVSGFYSWCLWGRQEIKGILKEKNLKPAKQWNSDGRFLVCKAERTLDNGRALRLCSGAACGHRLCTTTEDCQLDMPSKHACGRRRVGELLGQGGRAQGGRRGKWKWECVFIHVKFLSLC